MTSGGPAICITGMHRSGTSMIAKLIGLAGVHLGDPVELKRYSPDNEEGFFENPAILEINEELLAQLGGGWDAPPLLEPGWEKSAELEPLRSRATEVTQELSKREPWGWKDPRTSLTLPFWTGVVPNLRVLLCVRHPLEVAGSFYVRGFSSTALSLNLWDLYNRTILETVSPGCLVVTHYDSYFLDPVGELGRVTKALGLQLENGALEKAAAGVTGRLRHHYIELPVPESLADLYSQLCKQTGSLPEPGSGNPPTVQTMVSARRSTKNFVECLYERIDRLTGENLRYRSNYEAMRAELAGIKESEGWRLLQALWRLRLALVPRGSRRETAARKAIGLLKRGRTPG